MALNFETWWQKARKPLEIVGIILVCMLVIGLLVAIIGGYLFNWHWTGLVPETSEPKQHAKTLWDWLNLLGVLAIPAVVGLGAAWYTAQQGKVSERENKDNQHEAMLQAYIDKISELLLNEHLGERTADGRLNLEYEQVQKIARIRTITILTQLDARRIGYVFAFLREAGLMSWELSSSVVSLSRADLSHVNWSRAHFCGADFCGANLRKADLSGANLAGVNLSKADLRGTDLRAASLYKAILKGARYNTEYIEHKDSQGYIWKKTPPTQWPQGFKPEAVEAIEDNTMPGS